MLYIWRNAWAGFLFLWLILLRELPEKDGLSVKHMVRTMRFIGDRLPGLTLQVDTHSKHPHALAPISPLLSCQCLNVIVKRPSPQIIRSPARYGFSVLQGAPERRTVHFSMAGASVGLRGARCDFLQLTLFISVEVAAVLLTTLMEDIKVQL